jgi:hypothetical protein
MKAIRPAFLCLWAASGVCLAAPAKDYAEASSAYKTEVTREDGVAVNAQFTGHLAASQAKRAARAEGEAASDAAETEGRRPSRFAAAQGSNFASPQIYGTVRGDVTIVVDRYGRRGSITSVRR